MVKGSKKKYRAGRVKCTRCKVVWHRKKDEAKNMCQRCRDHCARCDIEFTDANRAASPYHGVCLICKDEKTSIWRANNKGQTRDHHLTKTYGITLPEYEAILESQGGVCWICQKAPKEGGNRLAIDHLHSKGENQRNPREKRGRCRGLLCWSCNTAIGKFGDSVTKLRRAALYLETWPAQKILNKEE